MHLEIDEGFTEHPKTLRFAGLMKDPNAPFMVLRLWRWACRSAKDGSLAGMEPIEIEMAACYRALDGACYAALVRAGFVDERDGKPFCLHNWMRRTGAAIVRMEAEADRKRWARAHAKKTCGGASAGCPACPEPDASADSPTPRPVNGAGRPDTVQSSPDQTSPDQESPPLAPARSEPQVAVPEQEPRLWPAYEWERRYSASWCETYGGTSMGGGEFAAKATGDLSTILGELTPAERLEAQSRAADMFSEFFSRQTLRQRRHPWSKFVEDFGGLRKPMVPEKNTGPPRLRDVRVGHAPAPQNYEYPDGEQPL